MKHHLVALLSGLLFGLGLAVSGMTEPDRVLNFLDVTGSWDPSLVLVMVAALAISLPGFAWVRRRNAKHGTTAAMEVEAISMRLLLGSALFGIGWGIAGYCPGPALANLARGSGEAVVFGIALLAGSQLARLAGSPR